MRLLPVLAVVGAAQTIAATPGRYASDHSELQPLSRAPSQHRSDRLRQSGLELRPRSGLQRPVLPVQVGHTKRPLLLDPLDWRRGHVVRGPLPVGVGPGSGRSGGSNCRSSGDIRAWNRPVSAGSVSTEADGVLGVSGWKSA